MSSIKILSLLLIFVVTLLSGCYPFFKRITTKQKHDFPSGEALAAGVFLGAGLLHMLSSASESFYNLNWHYPMAFLLAGVSFLILLSLEHVGRELYEHDSKDSPNFAILAVIMLSIHSFLAGAALGLTQSVSIVVIILLAILAHKWAASFALAVTINKSSLSTQKGLWLFIIFAVMAPLGIIAGDATTRFLNQYPLIAPIFSSFAAGTFLYLGTLHGLKRSVLVEKCCDLKHFMLVLVGFFIMAIVAIWT